MNVKKWGLGTHPTRRQALQQKGPNTLNSTVIVPLLQGAEVIFLCTIRLGVSLIDSCTKFDPTCHANKSCASGDVFREPPTVLCHSITVAHRCCNSIHSEAPAFVPLSGIHRSAAGDELKPYGPSGMCDCG